MVVLNRIGEVLGREPSVHAMTDVTGFGLLGHLSEMCAASQLSARLIFDRVPRMEPAVVDDYLDQGCVPGGTNRNWASYGDRIAPLDDRRRIVLCDPQTSGGLLAAVDPQAAAAFETLVAGHGFELEPFGVFEEPGEHLVYVE
jgi:selenide,water dikinase